jgi:hypothetical protein
MVTTPWRQAKIILSLCGLDIQIAHGTIFHNDSLSTFKSSSLRTNLSFLLGVQP